MNRTNTGLLLILVCVVTFHLPVHAKEKQKQDDFTRVFDAPVERVYKVAVQVAASRWHLQYSDKEAGTLSFCTGRNMRVWAGFDVSVVCLDAGGGRTRVTLHPQKRGEQTQLFAWKEGNRISRNFFDALRNALGWTPASVDPPATPQATAAQPGSVPTPTVPAEQLTTVVLKSTPDGADIMVDGKYIGSAPSTLRLPAGDHAVSIQKAGFKPWQRTMTVTAGGNVTIDATLEKMP